MIKKNSARLISLFIIFVLFVSLSAYADNIELPYEFEITDEMNVLNGLGIMDFSENTEIVNRAEFLLGAMNIRGYTNDSYVISEMPFDDVLPDNKCAGAIKYALDLGIIDKAENFYPDNAIDLEFATQVLMNAMGYKQIVELRGGYPSGCINLSAYRDLTKNIGNISSTGLTCEQVSQLLYNALFADIAVQTLYGGPKSEYSYENISMMNEYMHIYASTGRVTSNYLAYIGEKTSCEKDELLIDSVIYKTGNTNANKMLGRYIEYFYSYDSKVSDERKIVYYTADKDVKYVKIMSDNIDSYSNYTYVYSNEKGKKANAKVSSSADLIYNGKTIAANQFSNNLMVPKYGYVELIYGKNGGACETVLITSAFDCYADTVSFNKKICAVKDKYNSTSNVNFDIDDIEKYEIEDKDGIPFPVSELKTGMVLTVMKTLDGSFSKIIVSENKAQGVVQSYSKDDITVDGKTYQFSPQFQTFVNNNFSFVLESSVILYFDMYDRVAAVEYVQDVVEYGYLTDVSLTGGLLEDLRFKIFSQDGKFVDYNVENSIIVDGQKFKKSNARDIVNWLCPDGQFIPRLIKITYDEERNIKDIDTTILGDEEWNGSLNEIELHAVQEVGANGDVGRKFKTDTLYFDGGVFLKDDVKVFLVPQGRFAQDQDYSVTTKAFFEGDQFYDIQAYTSENNSVYADAIVCKYFPKYSNELQDQLRDGSAIRPFRVYTSLPTAFVKKVTKVIDDEGREVPKIYLYSFTTHSDLSHIVRWEDSLAGIEPGSVVKYYIGVNNKITFMEKIFDCDTHELYEGKYLNQNPSSEYYSLRTHKLLSDRIIGTAYGNNPNPFFSTWRMAYLDVISSSEGIIKCATCDLTTQVPDDSNINYFKESSFNYIFEYDSAKKELVESSAANIVPYDADEKNYSKLAVISRAGTLINAVIVFR